MPSRAFYRSCHVLLALLAGATLAAAQTASPPAKPRWYKGNTHTHTLNSDGDSTPDEVVRWYREHGYQFLVLTDHNFLTSVDGLNALHAADEKFLVVRGEEVTSPFGEKALHVNGLDVSRKVDQATGTTVLEILQRNVDAIRGAGGVPHINHPNFRWSISGDELRQVRNNKLFEIYNGHPQVNNLGGGGVPGLEEVWDAILSSGILLYGVAVDDAHTFKQPGNPNVAGPGRGWVAVRAPRLEPRALPVAWSKYRVQFIGKGGRVLSESTEPIATYVPKGDEGYVRARVLESNGRMAWMQPVVVASHGSGAEPLAMTIAAAALLALLAQRRSRQRA